MLCKGLIQRILIGVPRKPPNKQLELPHRDGPRWGKGLGGRAGLFHVRANYFLINNIFLPLCSLFLLLVPAPPPYLSCSRDNDTAGSIGNMDGAFMEKVAIFAAGIGAGALLYSAMGASASLWGTNGMSNTRAYSFDKILTYQKIIILYLYRPHSQQRRRRQAKEFEGRPREVATRPRRGTPGCASSSPRCTRSTLSCTTTPGTR